MKRVVAACALALAVLGGCGGSSGGTDGPSAEEKAAQQQEEREAAMLAEAQKCERDLKPLREALEELDSRLDIGLDIGEHSDRVADVKVVYDRLNPRSLDRKCIIKSGAQLEKALQAYIDANNIWQDCFDDYDCTFEDVESEIQLKWLAASTRLRKAETGLRSLFP